MMANGQVYLTEILKMNKKSCFVCFLMKKTMENLKKIEKNRKEFKFYIAKVFFFVL